MLHPPPLYHYTSQFLTFFFLYLGILSGVWKTPCLYFFESGYVVKNSLFFFLEIFLLQFSFEGFFTAYRTLGFFGFWFWGVLFCLFLDFKISFHCFLTYIVSVKKSVAILIFVSFEDNVSFSPLWLVLRFPLVIGFQWFVLSFGKVCFFFSLLSFVLFVESAAWITN